MSPIEYIFIMMWLIFGVIGWVRGFVKELGITLIVVATLLFITAFGPRLMSYVVRVVGAQREPIATVVVYSAILIFGVLIAYQGQTLVFPGKNPPGLEGGVFGFLVGLLNGYLVVGSLWYYLNRYGYPFGQVTKPITDLAMALVRFLPFNFIPAERWSQVLMAALLFLLLLRVIR